MGSAPENLGSCLRRKTGVRVSWARPEPNWRIRGNVLRPLPAVPRLANAPQQTRDLIQVLSSRGEDIPARPFAPLITASRDASSLQVYGDSSWFLVKYERLHVLRRLRLHDVFHVSAQPRQGGPVTVPKEHLDAVSRQACESLPVGTRLGIIPVGASLLVSDGLRNRSFSKQAMHLAA